MITPEQFGLRAEKCTVLWESQECRMPIHQANCKFLHKRTISLFKGNWHTFRHNKRRKMSLIFNLSNQPVGQIQVSNYALACQTSCIPCMCLKRRYAVPWIDREKERPTRGEFCLLCHCVTYLNLSSQRKQWQSQEFVCADKSTHISISNNMAIAIKSWPPISNMISYCSVKN